MGFEKWKPSTELERLRTEFDELIEHPGSDHREFKAGRTTSDRPVESSIDGGEFVVRVDLPGFDLKNIDLQVLSGLLTIKASLFCREIRYGSYERSIRLPEGIGAENLTAAYRDRVLELSAPINGESVARTIKVQVEEKKPTGAKRAA